ncbi:thiol-disulfide oxidoreductase DCC family protein [Streptomyces sp. NPDC059459]|uniref:thiol-disulfide oxidoreductase DCC family protein n=1 Tax=Streptomyces sp. NPDC059459 TaxID=3346839 RepID=UPI0036880AAE
MRTRRPVLVFDGDCGFCTTAVRVIERKVRPRCETLPWQRSDLAEYGVSEERARREVLWATPTGSVHGGAKAVSKLLLSAGGGWSVVGAVLALAPARWAAAGVYRPVAASRGRLPGGTPACALPDAGARRAGAGREA